MIARAAYLSLLLSVGSCAGPAREKYETAPYEVVKADGSFEIREYPAIAVVSAPMKDARGSNSAFMDLFRYISGSNEASQEIAMTTPVFGTMKKAGNDMSFVLPAAVAEKGAPAATNAEIKMKTRPAGRFAVYRFSGRSTAKREAEAREKLLAWIKQQGLTPVGEVEKANYDPPFTLPSKRRNEVLVRLGEPQ